MPPLQDLSGSQEGIERDRPGAHAQNLSSLRGGAQIAETAELVLAECKSGFLR